ncbi:MAG: glycosyltransferase family 2 protein [Verrucomicrobia bacterium]|nr:glycosyltransferase family 2 protein [Verrucomicrobiota bacterium]
MSKVSVYILAFNEEKKIADCIKSVIWADEVVVVDSHSTDKTAEIAESLGTKVVQVDFEGFGMIRMAGIDHTKHEWILSVDADERFTDDARDEVKQVINSQNAKDAYYIPRRNTFLGKKIRFCGWYPNYRQPQLFRRGKMTYEAKDLVHEAFLVKGSKGYISNPIAQIPFLDLSEVLQKMNRYSELGARKLLDKGKKCPSKLNIFLRGGWAFVRIYFLRLGILDGWPGFVIAYSNMEGTFYRYAKYRELIRLQKNEKA